MVFTQGYVRNYSLVCLLRCVSNQASGMLSTPAGCKLPNVLRKQHIEPDLLAKSGTSGDFQEHGPPFLLTLRHQQFMAYAPSLPLPQYPGLVN